MASDESTSLRCALCAEPLILTRGGVWAHDYPAIGIKLLQVPEGARIEAAFCLSKRCGEAGSGGQPSAEGVFGTYDGDAPANQMNAVNSAMLSYFAEEMAIGQSWFEVRNRRQ